MTTINSAGVVGGMIRRYSLAGCNDEIRKMLISEKAREVWFWINDKRHATPSEVADHFDLSAQHASTMLNKLYKQMYLRRHEQRQDSGGYEWVYYP